MRRQLPQRIVKLIADHRQKISLASTHLTNNPGSKSTYLASLKTTAIHDPQDIHLQEFYDLYSRVFTLPDEREPLDGFQKVLAFNNDSQLQAEFGPFLEPILLVEERTSGNVIGAANFTMYAYPQWKHGFSFDASCQLHFLMVREESRGVGIANYLLDQVEVKLAAFAARHCDVANPRTFITCEQNNPDRMTEQQIVADATAALIDPYERMSWWRRRGFRRLDFRYLQPPLSADHSPCDYLDYYARVTSDHTGQTTHISSDVLFEHLRRFFFVSVGKFEFDMNNNREWLAVKTDLTSKKLIALI